MKHIKNNDKEKDLLIDQILIKVKEKGKHSMDEISINWVADYKGVYVYYEVPFDKRRKGVIYGAKITQLFPYPKMKHLLNYDIDKLDIILKQLAQ